MKAVSNRIVQILNDENIFDLIEPAAKFELKDVNRRIGEAIQASTYLIDCEDFTKVHISTVAMFLQQPKLAASEPQVFDACIRWATKECERNGIQNPTPKQLRNTLGDLIYMFRISSFSVEEFTNGPVKSGVYLDSEIVDIYAYISSEYIRQETTIKNFESLAKREPFKIIKIKNPFISHGKSFCHQVWPLKAFLAVSFDLNVYLTCIKFVSDLPKNQFFELMITKHGNEKPNLWIENPELEKKKKRILLLNLKFLSISCLTKNTKLASKQTEEIVLRHIVWFVTVILIILILQKRLLYKNLKVFVFIMIIVPNTRILLNLNFQSVKFNWKPFPLNFD